MTVDTWPLSIGYAGMAPLRQTGKAPAGFRKGVPRNFRGEAAHAAEGREQCHASYRVLFFLRGMLRNCFSRLGLLLLYGLAIAPQFAIARGVDKDFAAANCFARAARSAGVTVATSRKPPLPSGANTAAPASPGVVPVASRGRLPWAASTVLVTGLGACGR